jgi:YfiH family protein
MIKCDASAILSKTRDPPRTHRRARQPRLPSPAGTAMTLPQPDASFHWTSEAWGVALRCRALDVVTQHLFTSKQLELPGEAAWRAALSSAGSTPDRLVRVKQVHGNGVRILKRGEAAGQASEERPEGDAIVSNDPGLVLAVMVADCVPILVCDPAMRAAAAIHAGWRGTCARVGSAAIDALCREFGSDPASLIAAIGPSIGPDDYEVGESLIAAFLAAGHARADVDRWFNHARRKPHLDLWSANRDQLIAAGVKPEHIHLCGLSTASHPDVFDSYRIAGERAGRMAALIAVPR